MEADIQKNNKPPEMIHIKYGKTKNLGIVECSSSLTLENFRGILSTQILPEILSQIPANYKFYRRQSPISPDQEKSFTIKKIASVISSTELVIVLGASKTTTPINTYDSKKKFNRLKVSEHLSSISESDPSKYDKLFSDTTIKVTHNNFSSKVVSKSPLSFLISTFKEYSLPKNHSSSLWLDIQTTTTKLVSLLGSALSLHGLTTEDIIYGDCKEKLEFFENYIFVVLKDPCFNETEPKHSLSSSASTSIKTNREEVIEENYVSNVARLLKQQRTTKNIFGRSKYSQTKRSSSAIDEEERLIFIIWAKKTVISIHSFDSAVVNNLYMKIKRRKKVIQESLKTNWIVHGFLDTAVDIMLDQNDIVETEMEALERYTSNKKLSENFHIFGKLTELKKFTVEQKKGVWPKKTILTSILSSNVMNCLADIPKPYFNDIHSHLDFISSELNENSANIDALQNFLMSKISLEITQASNHSADIVEILTVITTLSTPITVFGSVMGMNMRIPWQSEGSENSTAPFWGSLGVMLGVTIMLWFWLKWLGVKLNRKD